VALIFLYKCCKFGEKICNNSRDIKFFLVDYFFLVRPVLLGLQICMFLRLLPRYDGGVFKSSCWYLFPKRVVDMDEETAFLRIVNKRVQQNINNNQVNFKHVNINQLKPYSFHFLRLRNFVPFIVHRSAPYYGSPYVSPLSPPPRKKIVFGGQKIVFGRPEE